MATKRRYRLGKRSTKRTNAVKGNPRKGRKFVTRTIKGREAHVYSIRGKKVVIKLKRKRAADGSERAWEKQKRKPKGPGGGRWS